MSQGLEEMGYRSKIRCGLPVTQLGLTFYPITMVNYEDFLKYQNAITLRMSTLPVKYMIKNYFSALFSMDMDSLKETGEPIGFLAHFMRLLHLSLRIGSESQPENAFEYAEENGEITITALHVMQNGNLVSLTPLEISSKVRNIIADMNGLILPDENENIDLIIANEQRKAFFEQQSGAKPLKQSIDDLIASVAYESGCREKDVMEWTVREFELRKNAIDRSKRYAMYGQAELGGMVTFKKGNPAPSWCYDVLDDTLGTMSLSELDFGNAKQKNSI